MRQHLIIILSFNCFSISFSYAQEKTATSFNSTSNKDLDVCAYSSNFLSEKQVDDLITDMLARVGARNRYIIKSCTQVENCQATIYKGRPYILYNPDFLGSVKKLNFSTGTIPIADKDWKTITILAHELGHHINNHLTNPLPDATQPEMELEADETAGFIVALMGGTLLQAQLAYNDLPERGDYEHPGRQKRLDAIAKGWNDATRKNQGTVVVPVDQPKPSGNNNSSKSSTTIVEVKNDNDENKIFNKVEIEAAFPGGDAAWGNYLQTNLNPDVPSKNGAARGKYTVIVIFIVSKDGSLSDVYCETDPGHGMCQEAVRVIKNTDKWIPAMLNGRKVNAYRRQPITFLIE